MNDKMMGTLNETFESDPYTPEEWRPVNSTDEISLSDTMSLVRTHSGVDEYEQQDDLKVRGSVFLGSRFRESPDTLEYEEDDGHGWSLVYDSELRDYIYRPDDGRDCDLGIPPELEEWLETFKQ